MQFVFDPITLINLIFCIGIVVISIWWSRTSQSRTPLYIGLAFGLFGTSHAAVLLDLKNAIEPALIVIRVAAYLFVFIGLFFVARDAIIRQKAKEALRTSERKYREILINFQDVFYRTDSDGKLLMASPSWARLLGYDSMDECLGRSIADDFYQNPDDRKKFRDLVYQTGSSHDYEVELKKKDGSSLFVSTNSHLYYDESGKVAGIEGIFRDITEKKLAEKALSDARKKITVLNTITFRDIQNALFSLRGFFELERQEIRDPKHERYLEKEIGIARTISDSLTFARHYQNLGLKKPSWQDVRQSFLLAVSHLDLAKLSRKLEIDHLQIYADPLLERVFFALCENVLIHAPSATEIALSAHETGSELVIVFKDNGPGIPLDEKEAIFSRREQGKKGMGLFLSREILSITGITIQETGEPGKGARFEITVPKIGYRFVAST
ncbi:MAG: PAS domain S-box protein [Methanomicrobiales archaeon]|nr:PAS domain S-box protein [Methanomicrobiales archaeon]